METKQTGIMLPYEELAMQGEPMPDGLNAAEQLMYLSLRMLYSQHKSGYISRELAMQEKRKIASEFKRNEALFKMNDYHIELINRTELAIWRYRKNRTLENADRLIGVFQGDIRD